MTLGKLTVIYGPMFSGKTTALIELARKEKHVVVFKPSVDVRYTERPVLRTHDGVEASAIKIDIHQPEVIWEKYQELTKIQLIKTVIIDEVNLYNASLIPVVNRLLQAGVQVIAAGILLDTEKGDFGQTSTLLAMADSSKALYANCNFKGCRQPAPYTYAKKPKQTQVVVGTDDLYGVACEAHYEQLHVPGRSESVTVNIRQDVVLQLVQLGVYPAYAQWLRSVRFPYLRKPRTKPNPLESRLEIAGDGYLMGKSKLMAALAAEFKKNKRPVFTFDDKVSDNPYMKEELADDPMAVYQAEVWFIDQKYQQLKQLPTNSVTIVNVTPEMEFCYVVANVLAGRMSIQHFYDYEKHFYSLDWQRVTLPDLLIYISADNKKMSKKNLRQNGDYNLGEGQYQSILKIINRSWLTGLVKATKIIEVEGTELKRKTSQQIIVSKILQMLGS